MSNTNTEIADLKEAVATAEPFQHCFKVGDVVEPTLLAAPGFFQGTGVNMVVVEDGPFLQVACSNGIYFYPEPYEIQKKQS